MLNVYIMLFLFIVFIKIFVYRFSIRKLYMTSTYIMHFGLLMYT